MILAFNFHPWERISNGNFVRHIVLYSFIIFGRVRKLKYSICIWLVRDDGFYLGYEDKNSGQTIYKKYRTLLR
ncbi:hypothetical protein H5410_061393 [Solanum commersonii]|uniref:Uncharacterized protein n=1 Tax=Solanum commersonii TaxID=4109 RepID=A0A9J5W7L6_SOLCO|nr:hypothetical protein H5410_061393 [Solanum commersonii]